MGFNIIVAGEIIFLLIFLVHTAFESGFITPSKEAITIELFMRSVQSTYEPFDAKANPLHTQRFLVPKQAAHPQVIPQLLIFSWF